MAASTGRTHCVTCGIERIAYKCEGCSENFCFDHLADHRRALGEQLNQVEDERDSFRQTLTEQAENPQKHSLMQQINQWKQDSINKIQQTADEAEQLIDKHTTEHIGQIEIKLSEFTEQLKQTRKENDFNEIHLNQLKNKLRKLEDELNKPSNISIQQDSSSFINKISVVISSDTLHQQSTEGTPVDTLHQRSTEGPPTTNTGSPFSLSFSQGPASGSTPQFQFAQTPSTHKQETSNNTPQTLPSNNNSQKVFTTLDPSKLTINNTMTLTKKLSDPPTLTSEQSSASNQEQEETDTPVSIAERSLMEKKINTTLRDPSALVVDRSDPNSPLYSLTSFEELKIKPDLLKGIYNMNFRSPSTIQSIALPLLLGNPPKNIIAQSQSGTGKTAAFSLAILSRIDPSVQSPQALILAPTFELAIQIGSLIENMARFLPYIRVAYAVRDPTISKRNNRVRGQLLLEPIIIGTPGTVESWCHKLRVINLSKLYICCIDEADVMIATQGFQETCVRLVNGLNIPNCQMMLFSATYSDEVMLFARTIVQDPVVLRLKREQQMLTNIKQFFIRCYDPQYKYYAIEQIYAQLTVGQAMIFCRTKATARELAVRMAEQQHSVRELTAALDIEQRAAIINQFREGMFRVLISTNLSARGLDIDDVSLVINYDMPVTTDFKPDYETYLHRIGRCGRFGKLGYTFNLIGSEKDFNIMKEIEAYFSHPINEITIEGIAQLEEVQD